MTVPDRLSRPPHPTKEPHAQPRTVPQRALQRRALGGRPSLDLVVIRNGTYTKYDGPPIADPDLITHYPSDGRVPGKGTLAAGDWDDTELLTLVLEATDN